MFQGQIHISSGSGDWINMDTFTSSGLTSLWILLLYSVNTVNCQTPVIESFTGQDVLLPCVYRVDPPPETLSVYWRDKGDNIVLDIRKQHPYEESQSQEFRGRVESVPDLYKKGDFSIVLKKVQLMDSGTYRCYIPQVDFQQTVFLIVDDTQSLMMQLSPSEGIPVTAREEEDVLLPCVYRGEDQSPKKFSVHWRDKDDSHVLDIKDNKPDGSSQDQKFSGRVESFPDQFRDGNFSIVLRKVQQSDAGVYECSIPEVFQETVHLNVSSEASCAAAVTLNFLLLPAPLYLLLTPGWSFGSGI